VGDDNDNAPASAPASNTPVAEPVATAPSDAAAAPGTGEASAAGAPLRRRAVNRSALLEAGEKRRAKYLREKIKAAKDEASKAEAEAELAQHLAKTGQSAADPKAATKAEGRKADPAGAPSTPAKPAEWEDPARAGWPKPELIARQKAKWRPAVLQLAELLDDTPLSFSPRTFKDEDGKEEIYRPLVPIFDAWAAVRAKRAGAQPALSPEEALKDAFMEYGLAVTLPTAVMWFKVKMAEAKAREAEAITERKRLELAGPSAVVKAAG
jgi:hypothetical protein